MIVSNMICSNMAPDVSTKALTSIAAVCAKSYSSISILRGVALVALISLTCSCSLKIPFLDSAETAAADKRSEKNTRTNNSNQPNSSAASEALNKQPAPNSALVKREFENQIAEKVIDNYLISRRDLHQARHQFLTREALQQNAAHLAIANEQLQHLDQKLLRERNRNKIRQLAALQQSRQRVLKHWPELNHLNELDALWPKLIFEPLSKQALDEEQDYLLSTKNRLVDLQLRLTEQSSAGQLYSEVLLIEYKERLKTVVASANTNLNEDNPYLSRFQQQLLYASIPDGDKHQRYEDFRNQFYAHIQPAFKAFLNFLESLNTQSNLDKPLLLTGTFNKVDDAVKMARINELKLDLANIDTLIAELAAHTDVKTLYTDSTYLLTSQAQPKQMALNLLTLYVADIEPELTKWFYRRPSDEVLLVAADQLSTEMIHYEHGQVAFNLEAMSSLPDFEYESLAYQFVVPGVHMLAPWIDLHKAQSPMADAFTLAWMQYSQTLPFANMSSYVEDLSRIGYLVRHKRFIGHALIDLQLHTGQWNVDEASTFMSSQLPYSEAIIQSEIVSIVKNPGQSFEAWQLAKAIEATVTEVVDKGQLSLQETHQTLLRNSPLDLESVMSIRQSLLKRSEKNSAG
jgi:hypothetical protein